MGDFFIVIASFCYIDGVVLCWDRVEKGHVSLCISKIWGDISEKQNTSSFFLQFWGRNGMVADWGWWRKNPVLFGKNSTSAVPTLQYKDSVARKDDIISS